MARNCFVTLVRAVPGFAAMMSQPSRRRRLATLGGTIVCGLTLAACVPSNFGMDNFGPYEYGGYVNIASPAVVTAGTEFVVHRIVTEYDNGSNFGLIQAGWYQSSPSGELDNCGASTSPEYYFEYKTYPSGQYTCYVDPYISNYCCNADAADNVYYNNSGSVWRADIGPYGVGGFNLGFSSGYTGIGGEINGGSDNNGSSTFTSYGSSYNGSQVPWQIIHQPNNGQIERVTSGANVFQNVGSGWNVPQPPTPITISHSGTGQAATRSSVNPFQPASGSTLQPASRSTLQPLQPVSRSTSPMASGGGNTGAVQAIVDRALPGATVSLTAAPQANGTDLIISIPGSDVVVPGDGVPLSQEQSTGGFTDAQRFAAADVGWRAWLGAAVAAESFPDITRFTATAIGVPAGSVAANLLKGTLRAQSGDPLAASMTRLGTVSPADANSQLSSNLGRLESVLPVGTVESANASVVSIDPSNNLFGLKLELHVHDLQSLTSHTGDLLSGLDTGLVGTTASVIEGLTVTIKDDGGHRVGSWQTERGIGGTVLWTSGLQLPSSLAVATTYPDLTGGPPTLRAAFSEPQNANPAP